jgi:branched-chain amino acid aminotransferase
MGFLRSDATYDVVAVWQGSFFRLYDHLERFERGCAELRLALPLDRTAVVDTLQKLVASSGLRDAYVEVICTRGVTERGERDPRRFTNRFYAYAIPYVWLLPAEESEQGMDAVVTRTVRRIPQHSFDQRVKNFMWGDLTRALYEAYDRGARYPITLDADDHVCEGPGYNVFAFVDGRLNTPASGVLATSTAGGVMPITKLDGQPVGTGSIGPVTRQLLDLYWAAHSDPRYATPVSYETAVKTFDPL